MRWPGASRHRPARLRSGRHPAELAEGVLDLLVVSPGALGWAARRRGLPDGAAAWWCRPAGPRIAHRPGGQLRHLPSGHPDLFQFGRGSDLPGTAAGAGDAAGNGGGAAGDGAPLPAGSLPSALPGHSRNPAAVGHAPGTAYGAPNGGPIKQEETHSAGLSKRQDAFLRLIYLFILLSLPLGSIPHTVRFEDPDSDKPLYPEHRHIHIRNPEATL